MNDLGEIGLARSPSLTICYQQQFTVTPFSSDDGIKVADHIIVTPDQADTIEPVVSEVIV